LAGTTLPVPAAFVVFAFLRVEPDVLLLNVFFMEEPEAFFVEE
jgi:hypothetical protein